MVDINNYLPQRLKKEDQTFMQAFIKAINEENERAIGLIQSCIDQFFLTTATGRYLVQLGEEAGFVMPSNSGLDIRAYRVLVPLMISSPKQVRRTFEETIEAFYSANKTRPSITSQVYEPYSLVDGDDLHIETEKGIVKVSILSTSVSNLSNITSSELAAVINAAQGNVFADALADRLTGRKYLRLTCTTAGAMAFVRIVGGMAQNVLNFPTIVDTNKEAGTSWTATKPQSYSDIMTIKWSGGNNPKLYQVQKGDCLTIRGITDYLTAHPGEVTIKGSEDTASDIIANHVTGNEFNDMYIASDTGNGWLWNGSVFVDVGGLSSLLNGSYNIIDSGYDYVKVVNTNFPIISHTFTQPSDSTFYFTSQVKITIYNNSEYGLASEIDFNTATITVPAIPPLARRFLSGSMHLHGAQLEVIDFSRNGITVMLMN
jgi:hypothetical protein